MLYYRYVQLFSLIKQEYTHIEQNITPSLSCRVENQPLPITLRCVPEINTNVNSNGTIYQVPGLPFMIRKLHNNEKKDYVFDR